MKDSARDYTRRAYLEQMMSRHEMEDKAEVLAEELGFRISFEECGVVLWTDREGLNNPVAIIPDIHTLLGVLRVVKENRNRG